LKRSPREYILWRKSEGRRTRKVSNAVKRVFWRALENPVYFGKIEVKSYKDEEYRLVDGQHQALISETLFYDVQDAIDGKRKRHRPNVKKLSNEMFPLRGFLGCPKCTRMLTASASKGEWALPLLPLCCILRMPLSSRGRE
jgi:hypothetical protein